jgi:hypothetical protein
MRRGTIVAAAVQLDSLKDCPAVSGRALRSIVKRLRAGKYLSY